MNSDFIDQCVAAARYRIAYRIELSVVRAMEEFYLNAERGELNRVSREMQEYSPLFVSRIELHGSILQDMYDGHPGFAYFSSVHSLSKDAPDFCKLSTAMELGLVWLREYGSQHDDRSEYDGKFTPHTIVLRDQFGNVVQEYGNHGKARICSWLMQLPSTEEWGALQREADKFAREGSFESSWDNHDTARGLWAHAEKLRRIMSIAQVAHRVVQ
jgi:hypothetical protein